MELYLQHGRKSIDEKIEGWGPSGPRLIGIKGIHQTYGNPANVFFKSRGHMLAAKALTGWDEWDDISLIMRCHDEFIEVKAVGNNPSMFYADWGLMMERDEPKK